MRDRASTEEVETKCLSTFENISLGNEEEEDDATMTKSRPSLWRRVFRRKGAGTSNGNQADDVQSVVSCPGFGPYNDTSGLFVDSDSDSFGYDEGDERDGIEDEDTDLIEFHLESEKPSMIPRGVGFDLADGLLFEMPSTGEQFEGLEVSDDCSNPSLDSDDGLKLELAALGDSLGKPTCEQPSISPTDGTPEVTNQVKEEKDSIVNNNQIDECTEVTQKNSTPSPNVGSRRTFRQRFSFRRRQPKVQEISTEAKEARQPACQNGWQRRFRSNRYQQKAITEGSEIESATMSNRRKALGDIDDKTYIVYLECELQTSECDIAAWKRRVQELEAQVLQLNEQLEGKCESKISEEIDNEIKDKSNVEAKVNCASSEDSVSSQNEESKDSSTIQLEREKYSERVELMPSVSLEEDKAAEDDQDVDKDEDLNNEKELNESTEETIGQDNEGGKFDCPNSPPSVKKSFVEGKTLEAICDHDALTESSSDSSDDDECDDWDTRGQSVDVVINISE